MDKNRNPIDSGVVSLCKADSCSHNDGDRCRAGAIYFNVVEENANCYTYTTKPKEPVPGVEGAGQVAQCSVIDCFYNEVQACLADTISVSFSDGIAKCNNYVVSDKERI